MGLADMFKKKNEIPQCAAVIVAAGSSKRMGSDKIMMNLGGMPVIARTLLAFENSMLINEIVVVTTRNKISDIADVCKTYNITKVTKVVRGGKTRMESALAGVSEVSGRAELIAIHDGARPLVTSDLIFRTVYCAKENLAAAPVIRSCDTLKSIDANGVITGTVDRENIVRIQTPQVFDADIIKAGLTKAVTDGRTYTDDCAAVERLGVKIHTVAGSEENIKLTGPVDVACAAAILKARGEY